MIKLESPMMNSTREKRFSLSFILLVLLLVWSSVGPAAAGTNTDQIPPELIIRDPRQRDLSYLVSVDATLRQLRRKQNIILVDVRSRRDFERLHIPDSFNIALYALKTKAYLKPTPVVLVNEGFHYGPLESECRRLTERGFKVSILDGGLPAWKRKGGKLVGDLFALDDIKTVSPHIFFREKNYENTLVVDISPTRSEASSRLIPYAKHLPVLDVSDASAAKFKKLISKNKSFQSIIIFNETGEGYEKADEILTRRGIETFHLQGGVAGYQKYLEDLLLSWKSRDSRLKTVSKCKPCGQKEKE